VRYDLWTRARYQPTLNVIAERIAGRAEASGSNVPAAREGATLHLSMGCSHHQPFRSTVLKSGKPCPVHYGRWVTTPGLFAANDDIAPLSKGSRRTSPGHFGRPDPHEPTRRGTSRLRLNENVLDDASLGQPPEQPSAGLRRASSLRGGNN